MPRGFRDAVFGLALLSTALALARPGISGDATAWRLNPYPAGHSFAFTIVQDADSAYSRRLAPLFDEFDKLKLEISVTVFVFWADWAHNGRSWQEWLSNATPEQTFFRPIAVPLEDDAERRFYLNLAARGYEMGMHTASETSDTTDQTERAFAFFTQVFGHPPALYVEHSSANNKEALANEGANPGSRYYSLGILRRYHPWIWLDNALCLPPADDPRPFDLSSIPGAPFCELLDRRYGLANIFIRSGRPQKADGDGFLELYSEANIDRLERDRGLAMVYMHLDKKWLDASTRQMREPLRQRLRYVASKNGWFAPAGQILDRRLQMQDLSLRISGSTVRIQNRNARAVDSVSVIAPSGAALCRGGKTFLPVRSGDILLGDIRAGETLEFTICR